MNLFEGYSVSRYGGLDVLEYKDIEIPTISATEVLIHVHATNVNYADIKHVKGIIMRKNSSFYSWD